MMEQSRLPVPRPKPESGSLSSDSVRVHHVFSLTGEKGVPLEPNFTLRSSRRCVCLGCTGEAFPYGLVPPSWRSTCRTDSTLALLTHALTAETLRLADSDSNANCERHPLGSAL